MSSQSSRTGLGLLEVLAVVFVVLKLVGVIDWSWWWVLLPCYGPVLIVIGLILLAAALKGVASL